MARQGESGMPRAKWQLWRFDYEMELSASNNVLIDMG
jgi:hypothetical protein